MSVREYTESVKLYCNDRELSEKAEQMKESYEMGEVKAAKVCFKQIEKQRKRQNLPLSSSAQKKFSKMSKRIHNLLEENKDSDVNQ